MSLKYDNLWDSWLEAKEQPAPKGFISTFGKKRAPHWLKPEDMMTAANAFTPYDLYNKPDKTPKEFDYSTSAFNIQNLDNLGLRNAILMASENPKRRLSPIYSVREEVKDAPNALRRFVPQAIYEHELAHAEDPRLFPESKNFGYLRRFGLPGEIAARELPAMQAEDEFWNKVNKRTLGKRAL